MYSHIKHSGWAFLRAALLLVALITASPLLATAADFDAGLTAYNRGDYAAALAELRPLAEQGDATAQNSLGVMYDEGHGVPQDYAEAMTWYRKAAEQGYTSAQYNLGVMYSKGQGVPQDYATAHMWYDLAAAKGDDQATKSRDIIAKKMTARQVAAAQALAKKCLASGYTDCGTSP